MERCDRKQVREHSEHEKEYRGGRDDDDDGEDDNNEV